MGATKIPSLEGTFLGSPGHLLYYNIFRKRAPLRSYRREVEGYQRKCSPVEYLLCKSQAKALPLLWCKRGGKFGMKLGLKQRRATLLPVTLGIGTLDRFFSRIFRYQFMDFSSLFWCYCITRFQSLKLRSIAKVLKYSLFSAVQETAFKSSRHNVTSMYILVGCFQIFQLSLGKFG